MSRKKKHRCKLKRDVGVETESTPGKKVKDSLAVTSSNSAYYQHPPVPDLLEIWYICTFCHQAFNQLNSIINHERNVHKHWKCTKAFVIPAQDLLPLIQLERVTRPQDNQCSIPQPANKISSIPGSEGSSNNNEDHDQLLSIIKIEDDEEYPEVGGETNDDYTSSLISQSSPYSQDDDNNNDDDDGDFILPSPISVTHESTSTEPLLQDHSAFTLINSNNNTKLEENNTPTTSANSENPIIINNRRQCPTCHNFIHRTAFPRHLLTHTGEKPYKCSYCTGRFVIKYEKDKHERLKHINPPQQAAESHPCKICGKMLRASSMSLHLKRHIKRHKCSTCDMTFTTTYDRHNHEKWTHKYPNSPINRNKSKRQCPECRKYIHLNSFDRHMLLHTSDKASFQCCYCDMSFALKRYRDRHQRHIHGHTVEKKPKLKIKRRRRQPSTNQIYTCQVCGNTYDSEGRLARHQAQAHSVRVIACRRIARPTTCPTLFECSVCTCTYATSKFLDRHQSRNHTPEELQNPTQSRLGLRNLKIQLDELSSSPKEIVPQITEQNNSTSTNTDNDNDNNGVVTCKLCGVELRASRELRGRMAGFLNEHIQSIHLNSTVACSICSESFYGPVRLKEHMQRAHSDPIACSICDAVFYSEKTFRIHVARNHDDAPTICSICNKTFPNPFKHRRHVESVHGDGIKSRDKIQRRARQSLASLPIKPYVPGPDKNIQANDDGNEYKLCTICGKRIRGGHRLNLHMKSHSKSEQQPPKPTPKCSICDKSFYNEKNLKRHMITHSEGPKPFKCPECDASFNFQQNLTIHLLVHSADPKPFKCTECDKSFNLSYVLKKHIKECHIQSTTCSICGITTITQKSLNLHMLSHTDDPKPFKCTDCDRCYNSQASLNKHVKETHTESNKLCTICGKNFKRATGLKQHMYMHSETKPFNCSECGTSFNYSTCLTRHLLTCKKTSHKKEIGNQL